MPARLAGRPTPRGASARLLRTLGDVVGHLRDGYGRPKWQVRVVAVLAVIGLIGISAPALISLLQ